MVRCQVHEIACGKINNKIEPKIKFGELQQIDQCIKKKNITNRLQLITLVNMTRSKWKFGDLKLKGTQKEEQKLKLNKKPQKG